MWGHYANNHRGYCLIFELDFNIIKERMGLSEWLGNDYKNRLLDGSEIISFSLDSHEFILLKIKYSKVAPLLDLNELHKIEDKYSKRKYIIENSVGVKFSQWNYEKEFRLISKLNSKVGGLMDLGTYAPFLKITGVIMGHNLSHNEKEIFKDICLKHRVNLFQAYVSHDEYEIKTTLIVQSEKEKSYKYKSHLDGLIKTS